MAVNRKRAERVSYFPRLESMDDAAEQEQMWFEMQTDYYQLPHGGTWLKME